MTRFALILASLFITLGMSDSVQAQCTGFEEAKLQALDGESGDIFGRSVSVSGDVVVAGATNDDDLGLDAGAAYVYRRVGGVWSQEAKLLASDGASMDFFGQSVSVSGDVAVIGASHEDQQGQDAGAAYVFRFNGSSWNQEAKLVASDGAAIDLFGWSVAVDGDLIAVGAWLSDNTTPDSGSVYVYRYNGSTWSEEAKVTASIGFAGDNLGWAVAADGNVIAAGAWRADDTAVDSGAVYIFRHNGSSWLEEARLKASDADAGDFFGDAVALSNGVVVVGAKGDQEFGDHTGAAYVFRDTHGAWFEEQKLLASDAAFQDRFGAFLAVDGDTAIVGAWRNDDDGSDSGCAYIFRFDGLQWQEEKKLLASDAEGGDDLSWGVGVDGNVAVLGARGDDDLGVSAGAAYVFDVSPSPISFVAFGDGLEGKGGLIPTLNGTPCDWEATLAMGNGLGGADAVLWAGLGRDLDNPFYGGHFYIDFTLPFVFVPLSLSGADGTPGAGAFTLPTGDLSAFSGLLLYLQVEVYDDEGEYGRSFSNGMEMHLDT